MFPCGDYYTTIVQTSASQQRWDNVIFKCKSLLSSTCQVHYTHEPISQWIYSGGMLEELQSFDLVSVVSHWFHLHHKFCYLILALWCLVMPYDVDIGGDNVLLPDCTKPASERVITFEGLFFRHRTAPSQYLHQYWLLNNKNKWNTVSSILTILDTSEIHLKIVFFKWQFYFSKGLECNKLCT